MICLWMTLLSLTTNASEIDDTILKLGDPAPFYGVLVNPDRYKLYTVGIKQSIAIKENLDEYLSEPPPVPAQSASITSKILLFLAGMGTMGFLVALAHR